MGTGSNTGRGQKAGRAWAGTGTGQMNRLCSLTAPLKLKAPHTHTEHLCYTPWAPIPARAVCPTQPKNPKPHTKTQQHGPVWDLEITKKQRCSPTSEPLFQPEEALLTPKIRSLGFFFPQTHPSCFWTQGDSRTRHPHSGTEGSSTCTGGWVGLSSAPW